MSTYNLSQKHPKGVNLEISVLKEKVKNLTELVGKLADDVKALQSANTEQKLKYDPNMIVGSE